MGWRSVMSALKPSTLRVTPAPAPSSAPPPSPGTWRHPNFAEIVSRNNASTFSEQDFRRAISNSVALLLSFAFRSELHAALQTLVRSLSRDSKRILFTTTYITYGLLFLRLYLLLNLTLALLPLFPSRANDIVSDIPLTPAQRALMGLSPSPSPSKRNRVAAAAQTTPGSSSGSLITATSSSSSSPAYITPPRYKRTSFSHSPSSIGWGSGGSGGNLNIMGPSTPGSRRSTSAAYSSSPISGRAPADLSPFRSISTGINRLTNSTFSPTSRSPSGSPLLQKALASSSHRSNNDDSTFRTSFSPSKPAGLGLKRSQSVREGVGVRGAGPGNLSPALNYKWLYEKERRNSGLASGVAVAVLGAGDAPLTRSESIQF